MTPTTHDVSDARKTQLGLYVTSAEAYGVLDADDTARLLDVRTPQVHVFVGHAEMAVNIPLATASNEVDPATGSLKWDPNARFVDQVAEWAARLTRSW